MITWNSALKNLVIDLRIGSQLMSQIILLLEGTQQVPRHLSYKYYWMLYMYIYIYSDGYDYCRLLKWEKLGLHSQVIGWCLNSKQLLAVSMAGSTLGPGWTRARPQILKKKKKKKNYWYKI